MKKFDSPDASGCYALLCRPCAFSHVKLSLPEGAISAEAQFWYCAATVLRLSSP